MQLWVLKQLLYEPSQIGDDKFWPTVVTCMWGQSRPVPSTASRHLRCRPELFFHEKAGDELEEDLAEIDNEASLPKALVRVCFQMSSRCQTVHQY